MRVTVKLYGDLKTYATHTKPARWEGILKEGARINDVITRIGCSKKQIIRVFQNGIPVPLTAEIGDGDVLYFISHLGGG